MSSVLVQMPREAARVVTAILRDRDDAHPSTMQGLPERDAHGAIAAALNGGDYDGSIDPHAQAGRTGRQMRVKDARDARARARRALGTSSDDTPTVVELLAAASYVSAMLFDATDGDLRLVVTGPPLTAPLPPAVLASSVRQQAEQHHIAATRGLPERMQGALDDGADIVPIHPGGRT